MTCSFSKKLKRRQRKTIPHSPSASPNGLSASGRGPTNHASVRGNFQERLLRRGLLELIGREQADVRETGAMARVDYAPDPGLQSCADCIQQRGQRRIVGGFRDGRTGMTDVTEFE